VRDAVEQLTAAMNAHDPERVLSFYQDSDEFVYLGCTDLMFGSTFFKGNVGPYYLNNPDVMFEREILRIQMLSPTSAVVTLQGRSTTSEALFWTQALTRLPDGRWLISHEHESWPGCKPPPALHPMGGLREPGTGS
jgi:ketosteroid isomerase-like protein